jgi:hypothetical protein
MVLGYHTLVGISTTLAEKFTSSAISLTSEGKSVSMAGEPADLSARSISLAIKSSASDFYSLALPSFIKRGKSINKAAYFSSNAVVADDLFPSFISIFSNKLICDLLS